MLKVFLAAIVLLGLAVAAIPILLVVLYLDALALEFFLPAVLAAIVDFIAPALEFFLVVVMAIALVVVIVVLAVVLVVPLAVLHLVHKAVLFVVIAVVVVSAATALILKPVFRGLAAVVFLLVVAPVTHPDSLLCA